ncbi:MAG: hypothetical protein J6X53_05560 [Abditibacteriota bacterium]|nr:hypothetical protein [Abditibacteriota bacterium]
MIKAMLKKLSRKIQDFLWRTIQPDSLSFLVGAGKPGDEEIEFVLRYAEIKFLEEQSKMVVTAAYTNETYGIIRELEQKEKTEPFCASLQGKFAFIKTTKIVMFGSARFSVSVLDATPGEYVKTEVTIDGTFSHADADELKRIIV